MNILHINTFDNLGGASRAAYRLHTGLRRLGYNSNVFVSQKRDDNPAVIGLNPPRDMFSRIRRKLLHWLTKRQVNTSERYDYFSHDRAPNATAFLNQLPQCDIINLHWIAGFVDYHTFFTTVPLHTPVVWTLHDMNAFTGGCHCNYGCDKYQKMCGSCFQIGSDTEKDLAFHVWNRKYGIFQKIETNQLNIVTLSRWMETEVKRSPLLNKFPITVIPNGLDVNVFAPRERHVARETLGIPQNANIVLFVAESPISRHKGFSFLSEALEKIYHHLSDIFLISLGYVRPSINHKIPHLHLGYIAHDGLLSLVYSASDLFAIPSLQDNLPNTVMESMACGTPVVGFNVGGICDMVREDVTGRLVPVKDTEALGDAIISLLKDKDKRAEMSKNCRRITIEEYSMEVQARQYIELYEKIIVQK